jgi:putative nucleotidyltransferase with HDIG domain
VGKNPDISAANKVELAISQCESISLLPSLAARFFTQIGKMELTPASLAELIESDPAFTALILRLCQNKGITIKQIPSWIQQVLEGLNLREIRDAVLSAKIYGGLMDEPRTDFRKELTRHCLAVACCAEQVARLTSPTLDAPTAYLAGLLHDIGKFLLDEAMPKSFDTLLEQARSQKAAFVSVEQENLGTDHTILGKRFAQKMRLPGDIILGIWLHHSQTGAISQAMPQARIAAVVELADGIVRRMGIGESGSYDEPVLTDAIAASLGLTAEQLSRVENSLPEQVRQKSELAGLSLLRPGWAYCDALRSMAGQLADESTKLAEESSRLQRNAGQFDFINELLPKISSSVNAIDFAGDFAALWQKFYQTGPVCVYLAGPDSKTVEAVIVNPDEPGETGVKKVILNVPEDAILIPNTVNDKFTVTDVGDSADWLFEQLDDQFDVTRTKLAPLQTDSKTAGVIIFELRHQTQGDITQRFTPAARLGAIALEMLEAISSQQWFAERFAQVLQRSAVSGQRTEGGTQNIERPTSNVERKTQDAEHRTQDAEALAEMAAGAAHELNNPLSVIKGRAQMLASTETDANKKRVLEQIENNAGELSAIIDDLMSYANPQPPKPKQTPVRQIIDEAIDLAGIKTNFNREDIKIEIQPDTPDVLVDSAQIAIALSNIISNGLEAYDAGTGTLTIKTATDKPNGFVTIEVTDSGRGMDEQTLAKATQPFFSNKPAGRKRGMGLAHAHRLIQINNGTLEISSQQGKGTRVAVTLPGK